MPAPDRKRRLTAFVVAMAVLIATPLVVVASDRFQDVPDSNPHHDDISWLADNGVTLGCNPPANDEFCAEDPVLRQQMASFLRRLAENQVVDAATAQSADSAVTAQSANRAATAQSAERATTAQSAESAETAQSASSAVTAQSANSATTAQSAGNADRVDGFHANRMMPRAAFNATEDLPDGAPTLETMITAPAPGVLILSGGVDAFTVGAPEIYQCSLEVGGAVVPGTLMLSELGTNNTEENCATSGAATVAAGTHVVAMNVGSSSDDTQFAAASVTAMWVPLDGSGSVPSDPTQLLDPSSPDLAGRAGR